MLKSTMQHVVENGVSMVGIYRADRFHALGLWPYLNNLTTLAS